MLLPRTERLLSRVAAIAIPFTRPRLGMALARRAAPPTTH